LPDFSRIDKTVAKESKLMYLNYPNNPTGAVADKDFYGEAVDFCADNDIILVSDNPYSEITYDGEIAPSVFEVSGAMDVAIEMHSFSKTYNMTGWRREPRHCRRPVQSQGEPGLWRLRGRASRGYIRA